MLQPQSYDFAYAIVQRVQTCFEHWLSNSWTQKRWDDCCTRFALQWILVKINCTHSKYHNLKAYFVIYLNSCVYLPSLDLIVFSHLVSSVLIPNCLSLVATMVSHYPILPLKDDRIDIWMMLCQQKGLVIDQVIMSNYRKFVLNCWPPI